MARSAIGKMFKGSVQPALNQTTQFIDQSAMRPETMMRTPEERLLFHTRENQQLANQGLIAPESILPKAYLDAGQAKDIYEADMLDAIGRRRMEPSLQQELSLSRAGLPKEFIKGTQATGKRTVREGNYNNEYTDYSTISPDEQVYADENLGGLPTVGYGRQFSKSTAMTGKKPTPEYKARLKKGSQKISKTVEPKYVDYATNEDLLMDTYKRVDQYFEAQGFDQSRKAMINSVISKYAEGEIKDLDGAISTIQANGVDLSPEGVTALNEAMKSYDDMFTTHDVVSIDNNSSTVRQLRRDTNGGFDKLIMKDLFTDGAPTAIPLPVYVERGTNNRFWEVPTNHGKIMMSSDELSNYNEEMKRNYIKSKDKQQQYLLNVNPASMTIIKGEEKDYKKPEDFYAKGNENINGMFEKYDNIFSNDQSYAQIKAKDDTYTNLRLKNYYHEDGDVKETTPEYADVLDSNKDELLDASENKRKAIIKAGLLKKLHKGKEGVVYLKKTGPDTYEAGTNINRTRFLQENFRGGLSRQGMLDDARNTAKNTNIQILTPGKESVGITTDLVNNSGTLEAIASGTNGKIFKTEIGKAANKETVKKGLLDAAEMVKDDLEERGIIERDSQVGEARTFHKIPKYGSK